MADKEASVYIVDLGSTMADCNNGRTESDLDWSLHYVWDKIATTAQSKRKTWCVGVVGLRTDETDNKYMEDGYEQIAVLQDLGPVTLSDMKKLKTKLTPSDTVSGDAMSAIIIANEMIVDFTKKNKWVRNVYLVTDGQGAIDGDDVDAIAGRINEIGINLTIIGVDFDDPEYGFKEEDKSSRKAQNEAILKSLVDKCDGGIFATMAEAIDGLATPRTRLTKLVRNYDGPLTLGDPESFPNATSINVDRWPVTKVKAPDSASVVVLKSEPNGTQSTMTMDYDMDNQEEGDSAFNSVKQHRSYKVNDPKAPGGKRDVEFEDLAKGYTYGSTAVHVAETEWDITKLHTSKSFSIIGFVANEKIEPFLGLGETCVTVAKPYDDKSRLALSALVNALYELEQCAIARFVIKDGKDPVLLLLQPSIESGMECLYDVPLPFAEDARLYRFPPLDKVITITGKTLNEHRFLPDDKLKRAMSKFVDAMDISEFDRDDDGNPTEYAPLDDLYSPIIHRVNQVVRARAVDEHGPIEEVSPALLKYSKPPEALIQKAQPAIDALIKAADVKVKEAPKTKWKGSKRQAGPISLAMSDEASGLDLLESLFESGRSKKTKISRDNAVPEFKQTVQALADANEDEVIYEAMRDMERIVHALITDSLGDNNYDQALEDIVVMRGQMIDLEMPELYNSFLKDLKTKIKSGALGGDRRDMWFRIRTHGMLGLITNRQSEPSVVTDDEARSFWRD